MKTIKIWNDKPSDSQIIEIADLIKSGELAIMPTDSVYAIVCNALDSKAIAAICRLKNLNPEKNNLSIICSDISMASDYAHIDNDGFNLLKQLTPGPYTVLFRASRNLPKAFKGRKIVGIRIPDSELLKRVVEEVGNPVLSTSIEFEDEDHAREPELIEEKYENRGVDLMVDGGEGDTRLSTIIDATSGDPELLRAGKGEY